MNGKRKKRMGQRAESRSREEQLTKDDERQKVETKGKKTQVVRTSPSPWTGEGWGGGGSGDYCKFTLKAWRFDFF